MAPLHDLEAGALLQMLGAEAWHCLGRRHIQAQVV